MDDVVELQPEPRQPDPKATGLAAMPSCLPGHLQERRLGPPTWGHTSEGAIGGIQFVALTCPILTAPSPVSWLQAPLRLSLTCCPCSPPEKLP